MPTQIPTAEEEALQDPLIELGDLRQMGLGTAKALLSLRDILPLLGLMRSAQRRAGHLPPGYELEERFSPSMPQSYYGRPTPQNGSDLLSGETLMRHGFDPRGPGWERTWAPANQAIDYMPPQVRDYPTATRYMQNWIGKHTLDPYGPTDDGLMGTRILNRNKELGFGFDEK